MAEVLLIGDDRQRCRDIMVLVRRDGHHVQWTRDLDRWRELECSTLPEVLIAPTGATREVLEVPGRSPHGFPAPLLFVQSESEAEADRNLHLDERLVDRLTIPFNEVDLLARVDALLRLRRVVLRSPGPSREHRKPSASIVSRLRALLGRRVPRYSLPTGPYLEVAARTAAWTDARDAFEPGHSERVTSCAAVIADALGLADHEAATLLRAAMLHDIGKVALPYEVLQHPGPLEEGQMRMIRTHPERGASLVQALDPDPDVTGAIRYHHERIDGSGYYGKRGDEVSRAARILAVAESYDAMTTTRVKEPLSSDRALGLLHDLRGSHYDAECVDALVAELGPRPERLPLSTLAPDRR